MLRHVPGVPATLLNPAEARAGKAASDEKANDPARQFIENFEQYAAGAGAEIPAATP